MNVVLWPLEKIIPYARNARKIPPQAIDKVAASIREFGWRQPIVVDRQGVIICGHTRLLAAQKLGLDQAPGRNHGLLRGYPVNDRDDWLYEDPGPNPPRKAQGVKLDKRRRFPENVVRGSQEVQYEA